MSAKSALLALCATAAFAVAGCSKNDETPAAETPAVATAPEIAPVAETPVEEMVVVETPAELSEVPLLPGLETVTEATDETAATAETAPAAEETAEAEDSAPVVAEQATVPAPATPVASVPASDALTCENGIITEVETNGAGDVVARTQRCRPAAGR